MKTEIIYEDESVIVCHKKSGQPVQSKSPVVMDMESELKSYLKAKNGNAYVGIVHRLDQPVQGVMVFAKTKEAAAVLSKQVAEHGDMLKIYEARVFGKMPSANGELEDYLYKDAKNNISKVVKNPKEGKLARLEYTVIEEDKEQSLLRIHLFTGRHHQIRVQLANAGCPILGDQKYGNELSKKYSDEMGIRNLELKAVSLSFVHPKTKKVMEFSV